MKAKYLLCFISLTIPVSSHAGQDSTKKFAPYVPINFEKALGADTYYGPTYLENQKLDKLSVAGPTSLERVTVLGTTTIIGPAKIKESTLEDLHITGPLDVRKVTLKTLEAIGPVRFERATAVGKVTITGTLFAIEATFKDIISIVTDKMTLDQSTAEDIEIRKNNEWLENPQRVTLTNNAVVNGNITFEAGNGIVYIKKGATLKGEVKGGKKIEQKDKKPTT